MDVGPQTRGRWWGVAAGVAFLVFYLLVSPVSGVLADRSLPLPTAPAEELLAFYAANSPAVVVAAALQALSVLALGVVVGVVATTVIRSAPDKARQLRMVGLLSVAAMLVSALLSVTTAVVAQSGNAAAVEALRMVSFYAGGVVHVGTLGLFVGLATRTLRAQGSIGRSVMVLGYVAGALALLSITSLVFYYANAFLPVGRVLSMIWTVAAGVAIGRRCIARRAHS